MPPQVETAAGVNAAAGNKKEEAMISEQQRLATRARERGAEGNIKEGEPIFFRGSFWNVGSFDGKEGTRSLFHVREDGTVETLRIPQAEVHAAHEEYLRRSKANETADVAETPRDKKQQELAFRAQSWNWDNGRLESGSVGVPGTPLFINGSWWELRSFNGQGSSWEVAQIGEDGNEVRKELPEQEVWNAYQARVAKNRERLGAQTKSEVSDSSAREDTPASHSSVASESAREIREVETVSDVHPGIPDTTLKPGSQLQKGDGAFYGSKTRRIDAFDPRNGDVILLDQAGERRTVSREVLNREHDAYLKRREEVGSLGVPEEHLDPVKSAHLPASPGNPRFTYGEPSAPLDGEVELFPGVFIAANEKLELAPGVFLPSRTQSVIYKGKEWKIEAMTERGNFRLVHEVKGTANASVPVLQISEAATGEAILLANPEFSQKSLHAEQNTNDPEETPEAKAARLRDFLKSYHGDVTVSLPNLKNGKPFSTIAYKVALDEGDTVILTRGRPGNEERREMSLLEILPHMESRIKRAEKEST